GTAGYALSPTPAPVLVDQHDAVFFTFIDRAGRTRGHARRIEAVFANTGQVEHERLFVFELDLIADPLEDRVVFGVLDRTGQIVVPVRGPRHRGVFAGQQGFGPGHRHVVLGGRGGQILVIVGPGFVVVLKFGQM